MFGLFLFYSKSQTVEKFLVFDTIQKAREALEKQFNLVANNKNQASSNQKDSFHFFVDTDNGSEKRTMFISRVYKDNELKTRLLLSHNSKAYGLECKYMKI